MAGRVLYRLVALNCRYSHSCLALFYLRRALEKNCSRARLDMMALTINDPYYQSLQRICAGDPAVLFFSAYIWNGDRIARLAYDIARVRPELPVVIGGPQAMFLGQLPDQCTLVEGEVEGLAPIFYEDLLKRALKPLYRARGGQDFPFPYRNGDFHTHLKNRQILYESSRGCPFSCAYCLSATSKGVRRKPLLQVKAEIGRILAADPPLVKFVDRTFNDQPDRALAIWKMLAELDTKTRFHFEIAPDKFTEEQLSFLATVPVGRFQFEIGIQSTDPRVLAAVNRRMDIENGLRAIARLRAMENIHLHVDLILGLPEETKKSFARSFCDVFATRPHHIQMGLLKVLTATPLAGQARKYGIISCHQPPHEVLATRTLTGSTLARLHLFGECVERFYNNRYFPSLWHFFHESGQDMFAFFANLLNVCIERDFFSLAVTQRLLVEMLVIHCRSRTDWNLLRELLIFDWLRCGHRFLPDSLNGLDLAMLREKARRSMPLEHEPLYSARSRSRFFKQALFYPFSTVARRFVGLDNCCGEALVCFLAKSENDLYGFREIVSLANGSVNFS